MRARIDEVGEEGVDGCCDGGGRIVMSEHKEGGGASGVVCGHDAGVEGTDVWERRRWDYSMSHVWPGSPGEDAAAQGGASAMGIGAGMTGWRHAS